ncbi:hypothetical protein AS034_12830 [[Bacillus] enclensis]|nr:hypothetical protein AS034_12830 [[Bacillus] enclensis]
MIDVFNEYEEGCDLVGYEGAALDVGLMRGCGDLIPGALKRYWTEGQALFGGVLQFDNIIGFLIISCPVLIINGWRHIESGC